MPYSTYSFADVSAVISHPSVGQFIASGEGLGSITTEMITDRSVQDVAADGTVMVSKVKGRNGTIAIAVQQTSSLNKWLTRLYNYLESAGTDKWAQTVIVVRAPMMQDLQICTGVSFGKLPGKPYQATGQMITWNLMAADIQQDVA